MLVKNRYNETLTSKPDGLKWKNTFNFFRENKLKCEEGFVSIIISCCNYTKLSVYQEFYTLQKLITLQIPMIVQVE